MTMNGMPNISFPMLHYTCCLLLIFLLGASSAPNWYESFIKEELTKASTITANQQTISRRHHNPIGNHHKHVKGGLGWDWKDKWLIDWQKRALALDANDESDCKTSTSSSKAMAKCSNFRIPRHVPAREKKSSSQVIPRVIWMTWRSNIAAGEKHHTAVMEFIRNNPDYEFNLFSDEDALAFICSFYPDVATVYQLFQAGAPKSDLWRLAILHHYGGVYVDTDCMSIKPFRSFIWPNASFVNGMDLNREFHQWVLISAKGHEFLGKALQRATLKAAEAYISKKDGISVIRTTGPEVFNKAAVLVMEAHNCGSWYPNYQKFPRTGPNILYADNLPRHLCSPGLGVLQIYREGLSEFVGFKADGVGGWEGEMYNSTPYYQITERKWDSMFKPVPVQTARAAGGGGGAVRIGECDNYNDAHTLILANMIIGSGSSNGKQRQGKIKSKD